MCLTIIVHVFLDVYDILDSCHGNREQWKAPRTMPWRCYPVKQFVVDMNKDEVFLLFFFHGWQFTWWLLVRRNLLFPCLPPFTKDTSRILFVIKGIVKGFLKQPQLRLEKKTSGSHSYCTTSSTTSSTTSGGSSSTC